MKSQLFLLFIFSTILCSPFLRKTDEVTEESCQKEGKKYQETITYKCTTGKSTFTVAKKDDCKTGTWTKTSQCSAIEVSVNDCKNTPIFVTSGAVEASCTLNGETITSLTTKKDCETELVWTEGTCSISGVDNSDDCTTKGTWTSADSETVGTCNIAGKSTKTTCQSSFGEWSTTGDPNGSCTISGIDSEDTCKATQGTWKPNSETDGTCSISAKTPKSVCESEGEWTDGHCSVTQFNEKEKCKGKTPTFNEAQPAKEECKLGDIVIKSRTTKDTCQVELKVIESGSCSNKDVDNQSDCEAKATANEVKVAECVGDKSSNSSFLKAMNFALVIICLLF